MQCINVLKEMKKGIYLYAGSETVFSGIEKKIKNQIKVFSQYFDMYRVVIEKEDTNLIKSILWRAPGGSWGGKYEETLEVIKETVGVTEEVSFFYIRISPIDSRYTQFLGNLRKRYSKAFFLLEIPTYPYVKEYLQSKTMWPWYFKEKLHKKCLAAYIDRIVTVSDCGSYIWGIKTIVAQNGVDVESIVPISEKIGDDVGSLRIIAVAQFQPSHGYERVIDGLYDYYSKGGEKRIELHMVGEGSECNRYKKMTKRLGLNGFVFFHGMLDGNELENCYKDKDIGLGEFGLYKRGLYESGSLKVREYLARGLPVVSGTHNTAFDKGGDNYYYEFPNEAGKIDFNMIVNWYNNLISKYHSRINLANEIRDFSKEHVDISVAMKPIVDYLESVIG